MIIYIYSHCYQILTVLYPFYIQKGCSWCPCVFVAIASHYLGCSHFFSFQAYGSQKGGCVRVMSLSGGPVSEQRIPKYCQPAPLQWPIFFKS